MKTAVIDPNPQMHLIVDPWAEVTHELETECRRVGGQCVPMLGTADAARRCRVDLEQPDVPHPFEVGADGVDVEVQRLGDVGGGKRRWSPSQFEVDGISGVVAEGLQHVEARRGRACSARVFGGVVASHGS